MRMRIKLCFTNHELLYDLYTELVNGYRQQKRHSFCISLDRDDALKCSQGVISDIVHAALIEP